MKALKMFISLCLLFVFCISLLNVCATTENNGNILKNSTITANGGYYNGWYEYYRPISTVVDGNTYIGEGYNAGNMLARRSTAATVWIWPAVVLRLSILNSQIKLS